MEMSDPAQESDSYAGDHDTAQTMSNSVHDASEAFFARARLRWLSGRLLKLGRTPKRILHFGCGTGTSTPFLIEALQPEQILGVDVSATSLKVARADHGAAGVSFQLLSDAGPEASFDLAICSGVFHHIPLDQQAGAASFVASSLRPGGLFALWEHNPWSPGGRIGMSGIPRDRDTMMISPRAARDLVKAAGLQVLCTDFQFVFPRALRPLHRLDSFLSALPLGEQYQVLSTKV